MDYAPTSLSRVCSACQQVYPMNQAHLCPAGGAPELPDADPLIGAIIGKRYLIEGVLGQGSMGQVYRARHTLLGKPVAMKLMLQATDTTSRERFLLEAQSASAIAHANIVGISDYGVLEDGRPFLVMEFLSGQALDQLIARGPVPALRACRIGRQVAHGLQAVHDRRVVHRDLKPANVFLLDQDGEDFVKILDFGIAKVMAGQRHTLSGEEIDSGRRLTQQGIVLGTPEYMSPEQATGQSVDQRADQYALGCILYEMLVGEVPLEGKSPTQTLVQQVTVAPVPPRQRRPDLAISAALEAIVLRALAKDPEARYPSMRDLAQALQQEADRLVATSVLSAATTLLQEPVAAAEAINHALLAQQASATSPLAGLPAVSPVPSATPIPGGGIPGSGPVRSNLPTEISRQVVTESPPDRATVPRTALRRGHFIGAAAGGVVLVGLLVLWFRPHRDPPPPHLSALANAPQTQRQGRPLPTRPEVAHDPAAQTPRQQPPGPITQPPPQQDPEHARPRDLRLAGKPPVPELRLGDGTEGQRLQPAAPKAAPQKPVRRQRLAIESTVPVPVRLSCGGQDLTLPPRGRRAESVTAGATCVARADGYRSATYGADRLLDLMRLGKPLRVNLDPL